MSCRILEAHLPFILDPEESETRAIHELIDLRAKDVLEIGAGEGRLTWRLADQAVTILAIDPDEARLERARQSVPDLAQSKVTFEVGDVTSVDLASQAFDVAVLSWSL